MPYACRPPQLSGRHSYAAAPTTSTTSTTSMSLQGVLDTRIQEPLDCIQEPLAAPQVSALPDVEVAKQEESKCI